MSSVIHLSFDLPQMARAIWAKNLSSLNETFHAARVQTPFARDPCFEYELVASRIDDVPNPSRVARKTEGLRFESRISSNFIGRSNAPESMKKNSSETF